MITYKLRKDNFFHQHIGNYFSYGIDAVNEAPYYTICSIPDISIEIEPLENLIFLCNKLQLELIHLNDVIEDFLS